MGPKSAASGIVLLAFLGAVPLLVGCAGDPASELAVRLESPDKQERVDALRRLAELGPQALPALPAVTTTLTDPEADVRRLACVALGAMGEGARPSAPQLSRTLSDADPGVRLNGAFTLQKLAPERRDFVPILEEAVRKKWSGTIVQIGELGPQADWAVPVLMESLAAPEPTIQTLAAEALGKIGPAARDAIPALERTARSSDLQVSVAAKTALQSVRGLAAP